jgi:hypothetical protein
VSFADVTRILPSGENAALRASTECRSITRIAPVSIVHSLTVPSVPQLASWRPSGDATTSQTSAPCMNRCFSTPSGENTAIAPFHAEVTRSPFGRTVSV